jgi:hypothetical protein
MCAVSKCYEQIPCELEQGIIFIEQAIFGAEQGLLAFLRVRNGSDAAVVSHQHSSRTTLPFPPINYPDSARKPGFDGQT